MSITKRGIINSKFWQVCRALGVSSKSINSNWDIHQKQLINDFFPNPPDNFLRHRTLLYTMVVNAGGSWMQFQLDFLRKYFSNFELKEILSEDFEAPVHNSVHHLYHLKYYEEITNNKLNEFETIVEWGGGYGNLARVYKNYVNKNITYILIDIPIFAALQWYYLANIFGEENLNVIDDKNKKIVKNKFNIISRDFVKNINLKAEFFISTWALSESPKEDQDFVFKNNLFGAENFLFAYQKNSDDFPVARRLEEYARKKHAKILPINYIANENRYAFK